MSSPVYDIFEEMITSSLDLVPDGIHKSLELFKAMAKESFKLSPHVGSNSCILNFSIILLPII